MIAILPAAGLGKRMREVTGGAAKELLPVGGRQVLDWVLDEAVSAGCSQAVVVGSTDKADLSEFVANRAGVRMAFQDRQLGLAHAVACAGVETDALILLPDTLFHPASPSPRLRESIEAGAEACLAVEEVPEEKVSLYGIVEFSTDGRVIRIVEKPARGVTASRWAVAARYGFSARAMGELPGYVERTLQGTKDEVDLTGFITLLIGDGRRVQAIPTTASERRRDCGSVEGYRASVEALGK